MLSAKRVSKQKMLSTRMFLICRADVSFHMHLTGRRTAFRAFCRAARAVVCKCVTARLAQEPVLIPANFTNPFRHDIYNIPYRINKFCSFINERYKIAVPVTNGFMRQISLDLLETVHKQTKARQSPPIDLNHKGHQDLILTTKAPRHQDHLLLNE